MLAENKSAQQISRLFNAINQWPLHNITPYDHRELSRYNYHQMTLWLHEPQSTETRETPKMHGVYLIRLLSDRR